MSQNETDINVSAYLAVHGVELERAEVFKDIFSKKTQLGQTMINTQTEVRSLERSGKGFLSSLVSPKKIESPKFIEENGSETVAPWLFTEDTIATNGVSLFTSKIQNGVQYSYPILLFAVDRYGFERYFIGTNTYTLESQLAIVNSAIITIEGIRSKINIQCATDQ